MGEQSFTMIGGRMYTVNCNSFDHRFFYNVSMIRALNPSDREAILSYCYQQERENIFVIESFNHPQSFEENRYFGFEEEGNMRGVAVFFGRWGSFVVHAEDLDTIRALVDHVGQMKLPLESVPGFRQYAEPAVEQLKRHGFIPQRYEPSLVFSLLRSRFHPLESRAEQAREDDRDALVLLDRSLFRREGEGSITETERRRVNPVQTFLVRESGIAVSKAVLHGKTRRIGQIGGVVTHPEFRRKGYGRQCVSALCEQCFAEGIEEMILFTAKENIPAQQLYRSLGFEAVDRYLLVEY